VYGDKPDALARLESNIMKLKENVRNRLVLENDEMAYNIEDLLPISQKLKIPIVIDYHHDAIHPSSKPAEFYHKAVFSVWDERGIKPKVHISQSEPGVDMKKLAARRRHGNYIDFLPDALMKMDRPVDVMFEAKMKEESVLRFRALFEESAGPVSKPSAQQLQSEPEKEGPVLKKRKGKK
jgi:UV DNA damage endonuclease